MARDCRASRPVVNWQLQKPAPRLCCVPLYRLLVLVRMAWRKSAPTHGLYWFATCLDHRNFMDHRNFIQIICELHNNQVSFKENDRETETLFGVLNEP
jgi:hypothetical protein